MTKFEVEITETLQRVVEVEAKDAEEAVVYARELYDDGEIELDYSDLVDVDVHLF